VPASSSNLSLPKPRFLDAGESAIVVEFGRVVDKALHDRVLALDSAVAAAKIDGVTETVPTYRSLMVYYDARRIERDEIVARLEKMLAHTSSVRIEPKQRTIPVCYTSPHAEDLAEVAQRLHLSEDRIVEIVTNETYRVYMFGFLPGFAYLGRLPKALEIPRRETPRSPTPMGAVQIAAEQVVITGVAMTTGWYMIGRTPLRVFDLARETPFMFDVGDEVRFEPIDNVAFKRLS
jgi:inhibitor of KinA